MNLFCTLRIMDISCQTHNPTQMIVGSERMRVSCFSVMHQNKQSIYHGSIMSILYQSSDEMLLLKVALQILRRDIYINTKNSSLYSQSLLIFIHKSPVVESHPTSKIRDLLRPRSTPGLFLHEQLIHLHTEKTQTKLQP